MNYIGSKHSLLPFIEETWRKVRDGDEQTACDIFAGTGAVGRMFKRLGLRVIANDFQHYAYTLNKAYIEINHQPRFAQLLKAYQSFTNPEAVNSSGKVLALLNSLEGVAGFITENYSPLAKRLYYSTDNAEKADALKAKGVLK